MKNLLTGASILALAGVLAFSYPAQADVSVEDVSHVEVPEISPSFDYSNDEKEVDNHAELENTSEMEQASTEEAESLDEVDAENEEDAVEEDHTSAAGGWWQSVTQWFNG